VRAALLQDGQAARSVRLSDDAAFSYNQFEVPSIQSLFLAGDNDC